MLGIYYGVDLSDIKAIRWRFMDYSKEYRTLFKMAKHF